jgi:hypothetical protein
MSFLDFLGTCFCFAGCRFLYGLFFTPTLDVSIRGYLLVAMLLFFGGAIICWCSSFIIYKLNLILKRMDGLQ